MFQVNPIAHTMRQVSPLLGELHHILAAGGIVVGHRDALADILLGNAQRLLHAQLHGQSVGIPSGLTLHLESLHRLVAAEDILDGASHHVVDARHTVGRGRTLEENKRRTSFALGHTLGEHIVRIPVLQHFLIDFRKVKFLIFSKFLSHAVVLFYFLLSNLQRRQAANGHTTPYF